MRITISPFQFGELIKQQYSLDYIAILTLVDEEVDIKPFIEGSKRFAALFQSAIRKGILTEDGSAVSTTGADLLQYVNSKHDTALVKKTAPSEFDDWWKIFPPTDNFTFENTKFTGCRNLRLNKEECKLKFDRLISDGLYTASQIIEATKYDVLQRMKESVRKRANKLTYLQNSLTYLRQQSFESFIELSATENEEEEDNENMYV